MKRRKKNRKFNWLFNTLVTALFIIGLVLIFNKPIRDMLIATKSNHYQLENISKKKIEQNKKEKSSFDFSAVKSVDFQSVLSSQFNSQDLPVIGGIAIPDLKINLPIFKGIGNTSLLYGTGTMKEEEVMGQGNYSLAGHNMTGYTSDLSILLTPLKQAKVGMIIYVTDKENIYQYKIDNISTVTPEHVEVINDTPGKIEITLVTCADAAATHRTIVKGIYVDKTPFNKATSEMEDAFERRYNQINNL